MSWPSSDDRELVAVRAMGSRRKQISRLHRPPVIFERGHSLEMVRIDAAPNAAEMVDLETSRDWPVHSLIGRAMHVGASEADIAIAPDGAEPKPAAGVRFGD